jgi:hypothetical protein
MTDDESEQAPNEESSEWLVVPPTGVAGCPLEDWLAALAEAGEKPLAKRDPEGVWIHFENSLIAGFVSIDRGLVEAINFELPEGVDAMQRDRLRGAVLSLQWEIWEQNPGDEGDDWDEEFETDDI